MNIEIFIRTIAKNQFNDIHIYVTKESLFEYYNDVCVDQIPSSVIKSGFIGCDHPRTYLIT